jgi:Family of unknown function (DUF6166)
MKRYQGTPSPTCEVVIITDDKAPVPLPLRLDVHNHSPTGFAWGYHGSGPAQLALALLCDVVGERRAEPLYQVFKRSFVASLKPDEPWEVDARAILGWVNMAEKYGETQP